MSTPFGEIPAKVHDAFRYFDRNEFGAASGGLDAGQLLKALRHYGLDLSKAQVTAILRNYDDNPDGELDLGEFARLVKDIETGNIKIPKEEGKRKNFFGLF